MHTTSITFTNPETPTCEVPSNGVVEISLLTVRTGETSHCALENGADLHVNERQKIRHYRLGLLKKEEECQIAIFFTSRGAYVNLRYMAMLYTYSIEISRGTRRWCLKCVIVYLARDIPAFVMYCVKGESVTIIDYHSNKSIIGIYNIIDYDNRLID